MLMSSRNGLVVAEDYFKRYELGLKEGRLISLKIDGHGYSPKTAEFLLLNLLDATDGMFQFRAEAELDRQAWQDLQLSATETLSLTHLSMGLAKVKDDLHHRESQLPDPDSLFDRTESEPVGPFAAIWKDVSGKLEFPTSVRAMSMETDYPLRSLQLCVLDWTEQKILLKIETESEEVAQDLSDLIDRSFLD